MTAKEQVLRIYPDAVLLRDSQKYGKQVGGKLALILVCELPQNLLKRVVGNVLVMEHPFTWPDNKMIPLSVWHESENDCWEDAWMKIQRKMVDTLE